MFHFGAQIVYNGIRTAFRGGRGPIPRPPNSKPPMGGEVNKRRGAPRDGEGRCAGCDASEENVSDVEVRLHDMHVHDQVFITKNDEHFEEISMKQ